MDIKNTERQERNIIMVGIIVGKTRKLNALNIYKERKFKQIMDDKITKKTVIYVIILILLIGGYLTYLILQNTVFNENIKELNYYYEIENEDSISDILNENQTIAFKNGIQNYLEELEYKDKEINNIQIKKPKKENKKLFTCYVLLDDDWQSLYKAKFNIQNKKFKFIWNGDINNQDYKPNKKGKTYLYIVDKDAYENKKINDETENQMPDEDEEPEGEDVSSY